MLINPEILEKDGTTVTEEGCLSVPGYFEEVERADHVKVRYLDRDGNEQVSEFEDLLAVCVQHEIDHLDGRLFVDYLSEVKRQRIRKRIEKGRRQQHHESAAARRAVPEPNASWPSPTALSTKSESAASPPAATSSTP